jgi:Holliday junction resolvase RusA-like endonuclease
MQTIIVPMEAVGQPRHRILKTGRAYIPSGHAVHGFKELISLLTRGSLRRGPVAVEIVSYLHRPKAMLGEDCQWAYRSLPDSDNIAKAVLDAMNKSVYVDDRQVCRLVVEKRVSDDPRTVIRYGELT